jgi:putative endonuclease
MFTFLTKEKNSVFYVCITNSLLRRVYEHKEEIIPGFTKKQDIKMLVYYECYNEIHEVIHR